MKIKIACLKDLVPVHMKKLFLSALSRPSSKLFKIYKTNTYVTCL